MTTTEHDKLVLELLEQFLERPVAYHHNIVKAIGDVKAGILACQLFYWTRRMGIGQPFFKTAEEIEQETCLSEKEQRRARAILRRMGILSERYERLTHKLWFTMSLPVLLDRLLGHSRTDRSAGGEPPVGQESTSPLGSSVSGTTSERVVRETTKQRLQDLPEAAAATSGIRTLLTLFDTEFRRRFGAKPRIVPGKDAKLVQGWLKQLGAVEAGRFLLWCFESDDPFIRKSGFTIGVFDSQLNKFLAGYSEQPTLSTAKTAGNEAVGRRFIERGSAAKEKTLTPDPPATP